MCRSAYFSSFIQWLFTQPLFVEGEIQAQQNSKIVVNGLFSFTMGGAGRTWYKSTPRLWQCCMWGGRRSSWPGLEQRLGRLEVVRDCICECPLWPLFASDSWIQGQDGNLPLVLVELVQSCSMVMWRSWEGGMPLWKAAGGDEELKFPMVR